MLEYMQLTCLCLKLHRCRSRRVPRIFARGLPRSLLVWAPAQGLQAVIATVYNATGRARCLCVSVCVCVSFRNCMC